MLGQASRNKYQQTTSLHPDRSLLACFNGYSVAAKVLVLLRLLTKHLLQHSQDKASRSPVIEPDPNVCSSSLLKGCPSKEAIWKPCEALGRRQRNATARLSTKIRVEKPMFPTSALLFTPIPIHGGPLNYIHTYST